MTPINKEEILKQLTALLGKKPTHDRRMKRSCAACGKKYNLERHHITYRPQKTKMLCHECHKRITEWNTEMVEYLHNCKRKLSNEERLSIWKRFMKESKAERKLQSGSVDWGADNPKPSSPLSPPSLISAA